MLKYVVGYWKRYTWVAIISFNSYTVIPAIFQFFNLIWKIGFLKLCKIVIGHGDDILIQRFFSHWTIFFISQAGRIHEGLNPWWIQQKVLEVAIKYRQTLHWNVRSQLFGIAYWDAHILLRYHRFFQWFPPW